MIEAPTLAALIEARASATPDAPMLLDEHGRVVTFAGYANAVRETAEVLTALGIAPGDVVAWQLPTRIETVVLMGALARLGATQVPILPIHRERELRFMLAQSGAHLLCVPGTWRGFDYIDLAERVRSELGTFQSLVCDPLPTVDPARLAAATLPPAPTDDDAVRWVFYSSGTTSDPKGARIADRAAMAAGRGMALAQDFTPDDRYGVAFPFTHIGGLANLTAVLACGFSLALLEVFDPATAVDVFARHSATVVGGGPAFYRSYLEQQRKQPGVSILPKLRFMVGGGAPMPPSMHLEVRDEIGGLGVSHGYGMTETCSILAMNHPEDTDEHLCHTVGRVVPGMEIRAVTSTGAPCAAGEDGELRVRGEFMMKGYVDSTLDDDAFDAEGWFRTGDLGSIDADGYIRITGRLKDIIIRKGENISAKEIEDLLYAHPSVADVAVIGIPDDERGEMVCAVIALEPGAAELTVTDLDRYLTDAGLMRQKVPERIELVGRVSRNAAGKVTKSDLVKRYSPA